MSATKWLRAGGSRGGTIKLLVGLVLISVLYLEGLSPNLHGGGGDVIYLCNAKAIIEGHGFASGELPGHPPDTFRTPLFPTLLAGLYYLSPNNFVLFKFISLLAGVLAFYIIYRLLREYVSEDMALFVGLLFAVSPKVFEISHSITNHLLFTFLTTTGLWLFQRYADTEKWNNRYLWGSILFMVAALYTRMMGAPLLAAAVLYLVAKRQPRRAALVAVLIALMVTPWLIRNLVQGGASELQLTYTPFYLYKDATDRQAGLVGPIDLLLRVVKKSGSYLVREIPSFIALPDFFSQVSLVYFRPAFLLRMTLGLCLSAPIVWGGLQRLRKEGLSLMLIFVPLYFMPLVTISFSDPNYLIPIGACLLLFLVEGLSFLKGKRYTLALLALMVLSLVVDVQQAIKAHTIPIPSSQERDLITWIVEHTPSDSVCMNGSGLLYLEAGITRVPLWGKLSGEEILRRIPKYEVTHVTVRHGANGLDPSTANALQDLVDDNPTAFVPIYQTEYATLYSVNRAELTR